MEKKIDRITKLYPWYAGFTADLLFYIAIGSLFFTVERGFSSAQIVSLTTVSTVASLVLQFPILWLMKRLGNTRSTRIGGFFLLLSALLYTFGPSYLWIALGGIFFNVYAIFHQASVVGLENNLDLVGRREDFLKLRAAGNNLYAILTMLIAFVAGFLFNLNHYLPMLGCVASAAVGLFLSFYMIDYSEEMPHPQPKAEKRKTKFGGLIGLTLLTYGFFFTLIINGQSEQKLFIQEQLLLDFDVDTTALILGLILAISRIVRVISNSVFVRLYKRLRMKIGNLLTVLLSVSFALSFSGPLLPHPIIKFSVMGLGYLIILFIRDPFSLYTQDIIFENSPREQHRTLLALQRFSLKLATAGMSITASLMLLRFPLAAVIGVMGAISLVEIAINLKLYQKLKKTAEK